MELSSFIQNKTFQSPCCVHTYLNTFLKISIYFFDICEEHIKQIFSFICSYFQRNSARCDKNIPFLTPKHEKFNLACRQWPSFFVCVIALSMNKLLNGLHTAIYNGKNVSLSCFSTATMQFLDCSLIVPWSLQTPTVLQPCVLSGTFSLQIYCRWFPLLSQDYQSFLSALKAWFCMFLDKHYPNLQLYVNFNTSSRVRLFLSNQLPFLIKTSTLCHFRTSLVSTSTMFLALYLLFFR